MTTEHEHHGAAVRTIGCGCRQCPCGWEEPCAAHDEPTEEELDREADEKGWAIVVPKPSQRRQRDLAKAIERRSARMKHLLEIRDRCNKICDLSRGPARFQFAAFAKVAHAYWDLIRQEKSVPMHVQKALEDEIEKTIEFWKKDLVLPWP